MEGITSVLLYMCSYWNKDKETDFRKLLNVKVVSLQTCETNVGSKKEGGPFRDRDQSRTRIQDLNILEYH